MEPDREPVLESKMVLSMPRTRNSLGGAILMSAFLALSACGGSGGSSAPAPSNPPASAPSATPSITTQSALNQAVIVKLASSDAGAIIYYTTDGNAPTTSSQIYEAPFLVAANLTVKAMAVASGKPASAIQASSFAASIPSGTLVWADEFDNKTGAAAPPDPQTWGYDVGNSGFGNHELEYYCASGATTNGCDAANPNAYVGLDGLLHVVARQPSTGVYTSARLKSQGLFSFQYGRLEVRVRMPESKGMWPAVWTLGNSIATANYPASGEQDIAERVNGPQNPDVNYGSIHGPGFVGGNLTTTFHFPAGQTAADWHVYGMIWKPGSVSYYVDDPNTPYVTYKTSDIASLPGTVWPFDNGQANFLLIDLAVGGDFPGPPNATTVFPSEIQVDYIRLYTY